MGRKRLISDKELLQQLDAFLINSCDGDVTLYKATAFAEYLQEHDYPAVKNYLLRRNQALAAQLNRLKQMADSNDQYMLATFKTIDAEQFIDRNYSTCAMKRALSDLNQYYETVCESAVRLNEKSKQIQIENQTLKSDLRELTIENSELENIVSELKGQLIREEQRNTALIETVETYVYPEIANELLKELKLLKGGSSVIRKDSLAKNIITAETNVKSQSNVIKGMFDGLEDK